MTHRFHIATENALGRLYRNTQAGSTEILPPAVRQDVALCRAAPALLEAVKAALVFMDSEHKAAGGQWNPGLEVKLRLAISQAEGG